MSIKSYAKAAKQRIRSGKGREDRSTLPAMVQEEERVYALVCAMFSTQSVITDPLRQVADPALLASLSGDKLERYILDLSQVYLRSVERFKRQVAADIVH